MTSIEETQNNIAQAKSELNPKVELLDLLKLNALDSLDSKLQALKKTWDIDKYKLVVIGTIGSGKTTALCYLLDLLDFDKPKNDPSNLFKEELLVTGSGGSTVCEVHLKLSDNPNSYIETLFVSKQELHASLDDFAEFIAAKVDNKKEKIGARLPQEITRSIRNITGLKRIDGNDKAIEKYNELGSYERLKEYLIGLVNDLPEEDDGPTILREYTSEHKGKKFIKEEFKRINSSEIEKYSIPKQITIYLSKEVFGEHPIWDSFSEIIDTKGLDGQSGREDIDKYLRDSDSIVLFTSTFANAPSSDIVNQIEKYTQSSLGGEQGNKFKDRSLMLVLPRGNEPADKVGAEGDYTEGIDIAKEHIEYKMRTLDDGVREDRILFFNAKRPDGYEESRKAIFEKLIETVSSIKDKDGKLENLQEDLEKILAFDEMTEASKKSLINILKSIRLSEFIYTDTNFGERYAEKFSKWFPHWNTRHALNKRKGTWGGKNVFFLGKRVFFESIRGAFLKKLHIITNSLTSEDNQGLAPLIQPITTLIAQKAEVWSEKLQDEFYQHLKKNEFNEDNVFWDEVISQKIRGIGYNERVLQKYNDQLSTSTSAYIQNLVMTEWEKLLVTIANLLGGKLLKREIEQMMEYELLEVSIEDFQGIAKIEKLSIPENNKCIILTGENGYGKTSILRAILAGFIGKTEGSFRLVENDRSAITVKYKDSGTLEERTLENDEPFTSIVAYGANREGMDGDIKDPKSYHLFNEDAEFINIEDELMKLENGTEAQQTYFKSIRGTLLNFLTDYIDDIKVHRDGGRTIVQYREKGRSEFIAFDRLATGFKTVIGLIGDMIWRLANSEFNNLKTLTGIVIIDEFDLHLHPKWQKELLITLNKTFPKVQFIISTHSPIPFLGAPENTAVIEVARDENANITAEVLDIDFSSLQPNAILTSPIFKFQNLAPYAHSGDKFLKTEDYYAKILQQESAEKKVEAYLTDERTQDILAKLNQQAQNK